MGQYGGIIGGVVGAVVGFFAGGNVYAGWVIGSAIGGAYSASQQVIPGPKIGDIATQTSQEGVPRPIVFGRSHPIAGNVICDGGPRIVRRRESQGKGGPKVETESAYRTYAVGFCEGPVTAFVKVWKNNQLVYDIEDPSMVAENAEFLRYARFFIGTYQQMPSPDLEAVKGAGNVPAHRGTAYIVFKDEDVTDQRGMWSQWKVCVTRISDTSPGMWWSILSPERFSDPRWVYRADSVDLFDQPEVRGPPAVLIEESVYNSTLCRVSNTEMILYGAGLQIERYTNYGELDLPPPVIETVTTGDYTLDRIRSYSGVNCATTSKTGVVHFWNIEDGWYECPTPRPNSFTSDCVRLENGRWVIKCSSPDQDFFYSDAEYPKSISDWSIATKNAGLGSQFNAIVVSGNWAVSIDNAGYVGRSFGGASWEISETIRTRAVGSAGISVDGVMYFCDTNSNFILKTSDFGLSFEEIDIGRSARVIDYGNGSFVVSGTNGEQSGSIVVSDDGFDSWQEVNMPPGSDFVRVWKVAFAQSSTNYRDGFYPLASIINELADRCGAINYVDTSEIADYQCRGFTITNAYPVAGALSELSKAFFFDPSNVNGKIKFVRRGGNSKATITESEMLDTGEEFRYENRRGDTLSVPRTLHLNYYDVAGGLNTDKQFSERPEGSRSLGEQSLQTPVVLNADEAATVVAVSHGAIVESIKGEITFDLGDNYIRLAESDPVIVQADGKSMRCVVSKVEIDDGQQTYRLYRDRQSLYSLKVQGIPAAPVPRPPSSIAGPTAIEVLDIPILRDADDRLGFYIAVSGTTPAWQGAFVEVSLDGGENYDEGQRVTATTQIGYTQSVMADHPYAYPDVRSYVTVRMSTPDSLLTDSTLAGMMNRRNLALVGDEIINFASADELSPSVWELSYFLRGRKGTVAEEHPEGTRFVMLDGAIFVPADLAVLNRSLTFRATTFGRPIDEATVTTIVFIGQSQRERRPAYLSAYRSGSLLIANWQGVGRLGGGVNVAMGAYFAMYRVSATDGATTTTQDVSTMTASIDASVFTGPITVSVSQVNSLTGPGPSVEVTVQ